MDSISLSEYLTMVKLAVNASFPEAQWVRAEISSLSQKTGGHCYMELVESPAGAIADVSALPAGGQQFLAKIRANCWKNRWTAISQKFLDAVEQPLRVGMQVLVKVMVDFHPVYGMSLTIEDIDPSFTLGDLARRKQETLRRLEEDGVIDMQQSLSLPTLPRRIAVISSSTAAGYQDFIHQLQHNDYGFRFQTRLFEALMQGDRAAESVIRALDEVLAFSQEHAPEDGEPLFDAVVIIRGGGATTDLSCFDDYNLASNCAQFPLPVISGVGHTRDISVLDRVAFQAVKTPTAAAELFIGRFADQLAILEDLSDRLRETATRQVLLRRTTLEKMSLRLRLALRSRLQTQRNTLDLIERTIDLHSPERIFRMGYSLTTVGGKVVRSAADVQSGDILTTSFAEGEIHSKVLPE